MIKDYDEFRANMKAGTDKSIENLMFLKKQDLLLFHSMKNAIRKKKEKLQT